MQGPWSRLQNSFQVSKRPPLRLSCSLISVFNRPNDIRAAAFQATGHFVLSYQLYLTV